MSTILKTVTMLPGESFTLPKGATVISISNNLENSCNFDLPEPSPLRNYMFKFSINEDRNDHHPMGSEVDIESLLIGGIVVPLTFAPINTDNTGNNTQVTTLWSNHIIENNQLLNSYPVKIVSIILLPNGQDKSDLCIVTLKMPESYQSKVFLKIANDKFPNGLYFLGSLT